MSFFGYQIHNNNALIKNDIVRYCALNRQDFSQSILQHNELVQQQENQLYLEQTNTLAAKQNPMTSLFPAYGAPTPEIRLENSTNNVLTSSTVSNTEDYLSKLQTPKQTKRFRCNKRESAKQYLSSHANNDVMTYGDLGENENTPLRKVKTCTYCGLQNISKASYWLHIKTHMRPDKMLQCSECDFVTEFKHHFEYHRRNHANVKPFQCDKCPYRCVNKSMLSSHRKSHSPVYPYRCLDCPYATKHCHAFKEHLRKNAHKPDVVLDEDGVPNPSLVIDVYGSRRGPRSKRAAKQTSSPPSKESSLQSSPEIPMADLAINSPTDCQASDLPALRLNMDLQQQVECFQPSPSANSSADSSADSAVGSSANSLADSSQTESFFNIFPPLAALMLQNYNTLPPVLLNWAQLQAAALVQIVPALRNENGDQQMYAASKYSYYFYFLSLLLQFYSTIS